MSRIADSPRALRGHRATPAPRVAAMALVGCLALGALAPSPATAAKKRKAATHTAKQDALGACIQPAALQQAGTITPEEVRQVNDGDRVVIANPRPRVEGSVLMIGPTHGGRILTVVLNPERVDLGAWHVRTAWEASRAQIGRYRRDR